MKKETNEVVIRFADLFATILKAAKPIFCMALFFALLGGAWGAYRVINVSKDSAVTAEDVTAAEKAVENAEDRITRTEKSLSRLYDIEIPDAEKRVQRTEQLVQRRKRYIDNSLYYAMNPFHRGCSRVTVFVDTDTPVNPDLPWMSVNPQTSIAIAYTRIYPFDSEIIEEIQKIIGTNVDAEYIHEIVTVSNISNQFVEICCYFDDTDIAKQVTDYLVATLQERLYKTVGEFSANVVGSYVGYEVDWTMNDSHNTQDDYLISAERSLADLEESLETMKTETVDARMQAIEDAKTALEEAKENLEKVREQYQTSAVSLKNVLFKAVRNMIIFFIIGLFVCCVFVVIRRVLSGRLCDINGVISRYSFPLIGVLPQKKNRWFDKTIRNLEGESIGDYESAGKMAAQSLSSFVGERKVALVSSEGESVINSFLPFINDRIPVCGDITKDAEAIKAASLYDGFVLVEERGKSRISIIDSEVRRIESLGKQAEGMILL